jgi:transposase-like protein
MSNVPATLQDAIIHFSDEQNCHNFMVALRWPDGKVTCPHCGSDNVDYLPNAKVFKCYEKHERQKFSLKVGTIFEDSPISLSKWLPVMWMLANCKNGVSSYEISRAMGVTQKSAWFMLQRCRLALQDSASGGMLAGEVEVDETFIGGKARNMHADDRARKIKGCGPEGKAIVAAVLERGGKVRAKVMESRKKDVLQKLVRENVGAGSAVYSDALKSYEGLSDDYQHQVVDHAVEYVRENVHTNGMENFWSLLKRGISGTYVSVEPFHLFRYLDEQSFRFNYRKDDAGEPLNDGQRFIIAMTNITGKRLTYKGLIGEEPHACRTRTTA